MINKITYSEYRQRIKEAAVEIFEESERDIDECYDLVHEVIDSWDWAIYYHYADAILEHSENDEAYEEIMDAENIGQLVIDSGLASLKSAMAFWAMRADLDAELAHLDNMRDAV